MYRRPSSTKAGRRPSAGGNGAAAAACLVVVVALVLGGTSIFARESLPQLELAAPAAPAADAPDGMRKMMNYNGNRYVFLENGAAYSLSAQQLKAALGTLDYDIQADPQANGKKEFSTTFALGGTVYALADYDPAFRLAVEWEGNYYLCQRTGQTDNSPMDAAEYFAAARFPERIERVSIADHAGAEVLAEFPGGEISALIGELSQAQPRRWPRKTIWRSPERRPKGSPTNSFWT